MLWEVSSVDEWHASLHKEETINTLHTKVHNYVTELCVINHMNTS